MKKILMIVAIASVLASCEKSVSDTELTVQAASVIASNPSASVKVEDGQAHLSGTFASEQERDAMIASLKGIKGIEGVHNMTTIGYAEEELGDVSPEVLQKVKDALTDFPSVKVEVVNGEITLTGNVSATQAKKVKEVVDGIDIGKYTNNIVVK